MAVLLPLSAPKRYLGVVLVAVIILHYFLTIVNDDYSRISSFSNIGEQLRTGEQYDELISLDNNLRSFPNVTKANATFVLLARNSDLPGVVNSIQSVEDRFNRIHNYSWVLLNEEPFTDDFKERVTVLTRASISFGLIPREHWFQPDWIDEERARQGRQKMMAQRIIYGGSVSYRNMCRFNSGFFFQHELLQQYRYYWRIEPDVKFFCDLDYDPFLYMQEHEKVYSFTISLFEWEPTIPTLWQTTKGGFLSWVTPTQLSPAVSFIDFIAEYPQYVENHNAMDFLSNDGGKSYNLCHFWSNFEIADMDFWRTEAYTAYFNYLEQKGGFYYERWGDAPVHSIAAALFARRDQIHFFRDIGYRHDPFQHCPSGEQWTKGRCSCDPTDTFDYTANSCLKKFEKLFA
ncbi:glycosyltransferase family 15 protein [Rhodocollybia butyracea]|uniref:Glycosyltransferase family 15 protein n=1 Tax=Rhodocollybia butyracea TaxID=206335 RepID=A0A9P5U826_9AGAR|nr:glycosyltransferase family 15 protein [Rhodocollybia butyracea]